MLQIGIIQGPLRLKTEAGDSGAVYVVLRYMAYISALDVTGRQLAFFFIRCSATDNKSHIFATEKNEILQRSRLYRRYLL